MANEKWTKEPWHDYGDAKYLQLTKNDYTRAVVCVNECAGLSESQIKAAVAEYKDAQEEIAADKISTLNNNDTVPEGY